jgi:hypothetical protein
MGISWTRGTYQGPVTWTINPPLLSSMPSSLIPRKSVPAPRTWMVLEVPIEDEITGDDASRCQILAAVDCLEARCIALDSGTKSPIRAARLFTCPFATPLPS